MLLFIAQVSRKNFPVFQSRNLWWLPYQPAYKQEASHFKNVLSEQPASPMDGKLLRMYAFGHLQRSQLRLKTVHVAPLKRDLKATQ